MAAKQLEVFRISVEVLDAAVDRKLILMREEQQNVSVQGREEARAATRICGWKL